jgi:hypothetical protein
MMMFKTLRFWEIADRESGRCGGGVGLVVWRLGFVGFSILIVVRVGLGLKAERSCRTRRQRDQWMNDSK